MGPIQQQGSIAAFGQSDPVMGTVNRGKVADKEQVVAAILAITDKAYNAAVAIVGIDPLETVPLFVLLLHRRIFAIDLQQIPHIILHIQISLFLQKMPV